MEYMYNTNENLEQIMSKDNTSKTDLERISLFTILSENVDLFKKINYIYDFENNWINDDCFENDKVDFCSSSRALIRLGFNLYNGYTDSKSDTMNILSNLDKENFEIAMRAIRIRLNK